MKKYVITIPMLISVSLLLTSCGKIEKSQNEEVIQNSEKVQMEEIVQNNEKNVESSDEEAVGTDSIGNGSRIEAQSFEVSLNPLGDVSFSSYLPDTSKEPLADAVFVISKSGEIICTLEGMFENNIRSNEIFNNVEAVSFQDYNADGYDDVIIICSYTPASGPDVGTGYSECRIYTGSSEGAFALEKELSETVSSALAEITVQNVMGFLGGQSTGASWKEAYINYLQSVDVSAEGVEGYNMIYLNEDDIPELVEIGNSEAAGCRIVYYADGAAHKFQLNRLGFSYIQKENLLCNSDGNMDYYYDLVYSLIDGEMVQIAAGYYGAEDNGKVEFDAEGNPIYQYEWNGQTVSKDDYKNKLADIFDFTKAMEGLEHNNSRDEMIKKLQQM